MPLDACIAKVGTLSENDIAFLRQEITEGATDEQAISSLEALINQEADALIARIEAAGGEIAVEGPVTDYVEKSKSFPVPPQDYQLTAEDQARWAAIKKEVKGLGAIERYLQPDEIASLKTAQSARNVLELMKQLPGFQEMAAVARAGRSKVGWYANSQHAITTVFGKDAPRFTALLAAFSPRNSVEGNTINALKIWTAWDKAGRPVDTKRILDIMGANVQGERGIDSVMQAWAINGYRALTSQDPSNLVLSGAKANSFMLNLSGHANEVTLDAWMAAYTGFEQTIFASNGAAEMPGKKPGYLAMNVMTRKAGEKAGMRPMEIQETVWSFAKTLMEKTARGGETRSALQILNDGDLTHEEILGTVDFEQLFLTGEYRAVLEEAGYNLQRTQKNVDSRKTTLPPGPVLNPADKTHLNRVAKRIDALLKSRKAASTRAEIQVNLSAATGSIPGISALQAAANRGDLEAHKLLQDVAADSLGYLLGGLKSVEIGRTDTTGLFGGELEPALGLSLSFKEADRPKTLAMLAKFADNFNQDEVHVREDFDGKEDVGHVFEDGSFVTSVITFPLVAPLSQDQAQDIIDASGLPGLTITDESLEVYFAGDPTNAQEIEAHHEAVKQAAIALGPLAREIHSGRSRAWLYGKREGTIAFGEITGNFRPPQTEQASATSQRVATRLAGRPVDPQDQAGKITPEQSNIQTEIQQAYEDMPVNDLDNPDVQRAYEELGTEVLEQFDALTITPEAWPSETEEPYTGKKGVDSKLMRQDVNANNHLWFYKTTPETFGPPGEDFTRHPLLQDSGRTLADGTPLLFNDLLRIVHDYYAHTLSPVGFGPKGEEAAWRNHMMMTKSPWARWALTSETRGQNSWVNFRPEVQDLPLRERGFASQKVALMPVEFAQTNQPDIDGSLAELPGSENLNLEDPPAEPVDRSVEFAQVEKAITDKLSNFAAARKEYEQIEETRGGKIIGGDIAKEMSPDYIRDRTLAAAVHEPTSAFAKKLYAIRLAEPVENDNMVLFTAGGTGAGKTSGLNQPRYEKMIDQAHIVYDSNMRTTGSSIEKIDQALEAGQDVTIIFVYRDPAEAFLNGALSRAKKQEKELGTGRTVPMSEHILTHMKSAEAHLELREHYKNDPRVEFSVVDNSLGRGKQAEGTVEILSQVDYNEVVVEIARILEQEYADGNISKAIYEGFSQKVAYSGETEQALFSEGLHEGVREGPARSGPRRLSQSTARPEEVIAARDLADRSADRKSRVNMEHKDVLKRVDALRDAAQQLKEGTLTKAEYNDLVNQVKPIGAYESLPTPATTADMMGALHTNKQERVNVAVEDGHQVGLRLDIPAYKDHNVWVPTIHENEPGKGKGPMSHVPVAVIEGATFPEDKHAIKVASGGAKAPSAVIKGAWKNQDQAETMAEAQAALEDPAWVQVGFDPERHSYFFDRDSTMPVIGGSKVIQVGGLVLVKDAEFGSKEDFLFQDDPAGERGRYFPDVGGKRVIQLTQASDLSSFLHESGHMFLDIQQIWAEKYGMSENQQAMLDWLEADNFKDLTTEQHEKWAETFEVYLREGKAPSIGLRRAFASFTSWLKRLYRTLSDPRLSRAKLSPEITEIFDKMLATEQEIDMAKLKPEYAEMFQSQEQAGMTDAQWAKYKKVATKKNETAEATLDAKVMAQYKKMKSAEWKAEKAPLIESNKERLATEKVYQVLSDMSVIKDEAGEIVSDGRVDWHKLRDAIDGWPNGKNWIGKAVGGGVDPGLYADAYGYPSVKAMYEDVKASPTLNQAAEEAAEQQMVKKYGDILNDGTLETEVREAMLNEEQAEMLLIELKAEGRPQAQKIDRKTLKHQAELMIGSMTFKEIRPAKFYNQMIKAAQAAASATEDATPHKLQQLANHYLYKAAIAAKEQMVKDRKKVKAVQNQKFPAGKVDQEYFEAMKALAMSYDMRLKPEQRMEYAKRVLDFYKGQITPYNEATGEGNENADLIGLEMLDPNIVAAIRFRSENKTLEGFELKTFDEMTVDEIDGVVEMLKHLRYVGGQVANQDSLERAANREVGLESIEANGGKDSTVQRGKVRAGKMAKLTWGDFWSSMASLSNMVRKLDGFKDGGWVFENVLKPIHAAIDHKMEMQLEMYAEMEAFMEQMPNVGLRDNDAMDFTKEDGTVDDYTSSEIFMMAVYWGTESSREALLQGHELSENDAMELMSRLDTDQLNLVNQVWAMNESQWPKLQEAAKIMLGVAPPKLAATPFEVNGVQMTGGHMQLMYDSQALELADEAMRGMNTSNVVPMRQGSTHARRGSGGRPILLDTSNITQSMEEKTHYIAFARAGRDLRAILNNKQIQNMIEKKHGAPFYENLVHSVTAITRAEPAKETSRWAARLSRHMRQSATLMHLGYSLRNVMQQFPAALISAKEVGPLKFTQAMTMFASNPIKMRDEINAKSAKMKNRAQLVNRDSRETMKKILATTKTRKFWQQAKSAAFVLQTAVDMSVAYPTWYAKYNDSMEKHADEKRAVIEADQAVAESVGSGHDAFLGRIMQSNHNEFVKTLTIFGSWFNAYYQRLYKASKGGTDFLSGAFLMDAIVMPIIVANLTQMIIGDWPDEDEEIEDYLMKNSLLFMLATVPVVRDMASFAQGFTPSQPISAIAAAPIRLKQEIKSYAEGRQPGLKFAADVGRTMGTVIPMPGSGNIWRLMDYTASFMEGKEGDFFNPYLALTEGADKDK